MRPARFAWEAREERPVPPPFPSRYRRLSAPAAGAHCTLYTECRILPSPRGGLQHVCTVNPTIWRCGLYRRVLRQGMQRVPCAAACLCPFVLHPVQPATAVHAQRALPIRSSAEGKIREKNKCLSPIHALHHRSTSRDDDGDRQTPNIKPHPLRLCWLSPSYSDLLRPDSPSH